MRRAVSLRLRLFVIILAPLLAIAVVLSLWRLEETRQSTEQLFDRGLLLTAVAVARDVSLLEGNTITRKTELLLAESPGGPVRYHVYAPDGAFVIGYAVPPVPASRGQVAGQPVTYLDVTHRGRPIRVLRMQDEAEIGGFAGTFTVTVWQDMDVREGFMRRIARRNLVVIAVLIGSLAVIVWFGVNLGLKPLLDLEEAISQRSPEDLSAIRRDVPQEARGIVARLNHLFGQTREAIDAQNAFISDAAHQLRNPLAGIRALADSILTAGSLASAKSRAGELVRASEAASDLANRLLTLERIRAAPTDAGTAPVDLGALADRLVKDLATRAHAQGVTLERVKPGTDNASMITGDPVMLREMIANLIDNSLVHGGPDLSRITVAVSGGAGTPTLEVADNGQGVPPGDIPKVMARFGQARPSTGSGLGLPIAEAVARRHGGRLTVLPAPNGLTVRITLPAG